MGFRQGENPEAIEAARDLTIEEQSELLEVIGKATSTRGFGPFDSRLRALGLAVRGETGKARDTTSQRPQAPSSPPASLKSGSSDSPPESLRPTPSLESVDASAI